jgi:hypothetical protein
MDFCAPQLQEETTYLQVPCLTVRSNAERPITVTLGTNVLVGQDVEKLKAELGKVLQGRKKPGAMRPLWDVSTPVRNGAILVGVGRSQGTTSGWSREPPLSRTRYATAVSKLSCTPKQFTRISRTRKSV